MLFRGGVVAGSRGIAVGPRGGFVAGGRGVAVAPRRESCIRRSNPILRMTARLHSLFDLLVLLLLLNVFGTLISLLASVLLLWLVCLQRTGVAGERAAGACVCAWK